jgi:TPR repeat protein
MPATDLDRLSARASLGDPRAQARLGFAFDLGKGVRRDRRQAVRWYRLAAAGGDASARYNLALCYMDGLGVRRSYPKARDLLLAVWQKTSRSPSSLAAGAALNLGWMYAEGKLGKRDVPTAVTWYKRSARRLDPSAFYNLGHFWRAAEGFERAARYFRLATELGHPKAPYELGASRKRDRTSRHCARHPPA